jgi:hypothetical protein
MTELYVGNNTLLKVVDARNCVNLAANVDLSGCSNIEEVYFDGTVVTGVMLPNGGNLKTLHLPSTITNLTLMNQKSLTDLVIPSYANITTLRIENMGNVVDSLAILNAMPASSRVRLIGFDWAFDNMDEVLALYDKLNAMRGLDENNNNTDKPQMLGVVRVGTITTELINKFKEKYPNIEFVYSELIANTVLGLSELGSSIL